MAQGIGTVTSTTEEVNDELAPKLPQVGSRIKELRRAKKMSLQELAVASGVSVGMLSQIERDRANPSLRVLTQIRHALGAPINALFSDEVQPPPDPDFVRRASRRPTLELGYLSKELLSSGGPHHLQFMILHITPHGTSGDQPLSYPAEKGGMILEGELWLRVGEEEAHLSEGDSFLFDSSLPHSFRNPTDAVVKVLWIIGAVRVDRHL